MDNYIFKCFDEDISVTEEERLCDYLCYKEAEEEKDISLIINYL